MYQFCVNLRKMGRLSDEQVDALVANGRLTEEQGETIKAM